MGKIKYASQEEKEQGYAIETWFVVYMYCKSQNLFRVGLRCGGCCTRWKRRYFDGLMGCKEGYWSPPKSSFGGAQSS